MMKTNTKITAAVLLSSFLLASVSGCDFSRNELASDHENGEVSSETTESSENTVSTKAEDEEEIYEVVGEGLTENELYDKYRDIAKQIYINDGKDYLYGFGKEYLNGYVCENSEYALFVFDENDNLMEFKYQDGNIVKYKPCEMYDVDHLLTFDQFYHLPCLFNQYAIHADELMIETFKSVPGDGKYTGTVIGFSSDMNYAIALVGQIYAFTLSKKDCTYMKKGDVIEVDGDSHDYVTVTDIDDYGESIRIEVDDYCWFLFDKNDMEDEREYILTKFEQPYYTDSYSFIMIPISEDCKFDLYFVHGDVDGESLICNEKDLSVDEAREMILKNSDIVNDEGKTIITSYENGGFKMVDSIVKPIQIKDGMITYINLIRCVE